jgi:hypothetical protein
MRLFSKFILIACIVPSCSGTQSIKYLSDLAQANIRGPVVKLVTESYGVDSLGGIGKLRSATTEIFNDLGYTVSDTSTDFPGNNEVVNTLQYNQNGSLSSLITFENGKKRSHMLVNYSGDKCILMSVYDGKEKLQSYYDNISQTSHGLLVRASNFDTNGKLIMSFVNEYDSIYQVRATSRNNHGGLQSDVAMRLTEKKYQKDVLEVTYDRDSTVRNYFSYNYDRWDSIGNWTRRTTMDDNKKVIEVVKRIFSYRL